MRSFPTRGLRWLTWDRIGLFLAVGVLTVLCIHNNTVKNIALDEGFSLDTASRTAGDTFWRAVRFEAQGPSYFVVLHYWLKLGDGIEFARLLSTLCVVGTAFIAHRIGLALELNRRGVSLPLLVALLPSVLWAGSEARGYALTLFLVTLAMHAFILLWVRHEPPPRWAAPMYVASCASAVLTSYYAAFLVLVFAVAAWFGVRRRRLVMTTHLATGALLLPLVLVVPDQVSQHAYYVQPIDLARGGVLEWVASLAAWSARTTFYAAFQGIPGLGRIPLVQFGGMILMIVLVVMRLRSHHPWSARVEGIFGLTAIVPALILLSLRALELSVVEQRHWTFALLAPIVFLSILTAGISNSTGRAAVSLGSLAFFALTAGLYQSSCARDCTDDWRSAARYIEAREQPGEPIVLFSPYSALQFRQYYRGVNSFRGIPGDRPWQSETLGRVVADTAVVNRSAFEGSLQPILSTANVVWLIVWYGGAGDRLAAESLGEYLCERTDVEDHADHTGSSPSGGLHVWRLRVRRPAEPRSCRLSTLGS